MNKIIIPAIFFVFLISCRNEKPTIEDLLSSRWEVLNRVKETVDGEILDIEIIYDLKNGGELVVTTNDPGFSIVSLYTQPSTRLYVWELEDNDNTIYFHFPNIGQTEQDLYWDIISIDSKYMVVEVLDYQRVFITEMVLKRLN